MKYKYIVCTKSYINKDIHRYVYICPRYLVGTKNFKSDINFKKLISLKIMVEKN